MFIEFSSTIYCGQLWGKPVDKSRYLDQDDFVSPYLLEPLRSLEEVLKEREARSLESGKVTVRSAMVERAGRAGSD